MDLTGKGSFSEGAGCNISFLFFLFLFLFGGCRGGGCAEGRMVGEEAGG